MNYEIYKSKKIINKNKTQKKYIVIDAIKNYELFDKMQLIQNCIKSSNDLFIDIVENEIDNALKNLNIKFDDVKK
jgi:ribosomal protein S21